MTRTAFSLPQTKAGICLAYTGFETDLLFNHGAELPRFASYPLLETSEGRALLRQSYEAFMAVGAEAGAGVILESTTWLANRDRGAVIGYDPKALAEANRAAMDFMDDVRGGRTNVVLSANVGPREDAYAPRHQMSVAEATEYHSEQIAVLAETAADVVSGYTLSYANEAAGIALAAKRFGLPVVIAFTVETDGRLPTGTTLEEALAAVDSAADGYPAYYMVNCAHPEHLQGALIGATCQTRLRGIVANASRCSHAELDNAEELDCGDPVEFGHQMGALRRAHSQIDVLGGCCGTDTRHLRQILAALS